MRWLQWLLQFWELRSLAQTRQTTEEKQIKLNIRQVKYNSVYVS